MVCLNPLQSIWLNGHNLMCKLWVQEPTKAINFIIQQSKKIPRLGTKSKPMYFFKEKPWSLKMQISISPVETFKKFNKLVYPLCELPYSKCRGSKNKLLTHNTSHQKRSQNIYLASVDNFLRLPPATEKKVLMIIPKTLESSRGKFIITRKVTQMNRSTTEE